MGRAYIIGAAAAIGVSGIVVLIGVTVIQPPPGPPLATLDIESGKPFELAFVSDGEAARIWVDMACDSCSLPLEGEIAVYRGQQELASNEVMAGDSRDRAWGGTSRRLQQHLIFDVDAQPAGTELSVRGKLTVGVAKGNLSPTPIEGAPPPKVRLLRVSVAP